jgi:hypothetical protein
MKRAELNNLNSLLTTEVKAYANTTMEEILTRIKTYKNVYEVLGIEEEYHKTINEAYIPHLNIDFYNREKLISIIEVLDDNEIRIEENILGGLENFTAYLSELVWELSIDAEDIKKMERALNKM